jgi:predicted ArsR family transcriptional regulator
VSGDPARAKTTRERVLEATRDAQCDYAANIAHDAGMPLSTVRRHLGALEADGLVRGVLHDERDTLPNGRRRVYWNVVDDKDAGV